MKKKRKKYLYLPSDGLLCRFVFIFYRRETIKITGISIKKKHYALLKSAIKQINSKQNKVVSATLGGLEEKQWCQRKCELVMRYSFRAVKKNKNTDAESRIFKYIRLA